MFRNFSDVLADYIRRRSPLVFCRACIASTFDATETVMQKPLKKLLARPGFKSIPGVCCGCVRSEDVIEWSPPAVDEIIEKP